MSGRLGPRRGVDLLQGLLPAGHERLTVKAADDLALEAALGPRHVGEDPLDLGYPAGQVFPGLSTDLDADLGVVRVGGVVGAAGEGAGVEYRPAAHRMWLRLECPAVVRVHPRDDLGEVHNRVHALIWHASVRGHAVADDVDPAESLVLDHEFGVGLRLQNYAGVNALTVRGQMFRADGAALLVRDARDQQVPAQPDAGLGQCSQGEHRGRDARLVVGRAEAVHDVALDPRYQGLVRPAGEPDGVAVRGQAQGRPAASSA